MIVLPQEYNTSRQRQSLIDFDSPDPLHLGAPLTAPWHATGYPAHAPAPTDTDEKTAACCLDLPPDPGATQTPSWALLAASESVHSLGTAYATALTLHTVPFYTYSHTLQVLSPLSNPPFEPTAPKAQRCAIATDVVPQLRGPPGQYDGAAAATDPRPTPLISMKHWLKSSPTIPGAIAPMLYTDPPPAAPNPATYLSETDPPMPHAPSRCVHPTIRSPPLAPVAPDTRPIPPMNWQTRG